VDIHAATKHCVQMTKGEKLYTCVSRCVDIHAATKHRVQMTESEKLYTCEIKIF
jgi:hypothetical protein